MPAPLRCLLGFCLVLAVLGQPFEESGQVGMPRPTKKSGSRAAKKSRQNNLKEANGPTLPQHPPRSHFQQQQKTGELGCCPELFPSFWVRLAGGRCSQNRSLRRSSSSPTRFAGGR